MLRRIAHLDMDAFYASVELLRYPQLKGLPVVIGAARRDEDDTLCQTAEHHAISRIPLDAFPRLKDYTGRGVITTATYAARQFGVGSALGLMKVAKLCPQAILLLVDFNEYRKYSRTLKAIITDIAPRMEDRGVDEVYIDFTEVPGGQREGGRVLARLVQKAIFDQTGLTSSVGVAPNKLLAKMASEFNKPNGISIVFEADLQGLRPPFACARLRKEGAALVYRCAKQHSEPTGDKRGAKVDELTLTPLELIDRIAALVPPPRTHRHRYFGVLAPNSPLRAAVTALAAPPEATVQPEPADTSQGTPGVVPQGNVVPTQPEPAPPKRAPVHYLWAVLIARV
jgi:hypothetical protein